MAFRFEGLQVYQKALDLVDCIYNLVEHFPQHEIYALASQLRRAVTSIVLNIAEGTGRSTKEFSHFIDMARTSAYECVAALTIAKRRSYLTQGQYDEVYMQLTEVIKMLHGLNNSL